jgi:hypothetical protein
MRMTLFLSIMHKLSEPSPYFSERYDVTGRIGLTALQKCTTVVHQLAYGMAADRMRETTTTMRTIILSLPSLLHLSPTRHRLVSHPFFKGDTFNFWIDIFEPSNQFDRDCVEQIPLD